VQVAIAPFKRNTYEENCIQIMEFKKPQPVQKRFTDNIAKLPELVARKD
jgi:hypothetical protein